VTELASDAQAVVAAADKKGVPQDYLLTILLLTRDAQISQAKLVDRVVAVIRKEADRRGTGEDTPSRA
jgi:hypothetical protein